MTPPVHILQLDDCSHCACVTVLQGYTEQSAIEALDRGELSCANCSDECNDNDTAGHVQCVTLRVDGEIKWDGRCGQ